MPRDDAAWAGFTWDAMLSGAPGHPAGAEFAETIAQLHAGDDAPHADAAFIAQLGFQLSSEPAHPLKERQMSQPARLFSNNSARLPNRGRAMANSWRRPGRAFNTAATILLIVTVAAGALLINRPAKDSDSQIAQIAAPATPAPACPVTLPNGSAAPGKLPMDLVYGNDQLWTNVWPQGVVLLTPALGDKPGVPFEMKWGWWRGTPGKLAITGRRLDGDSPPLTATIPDGYGNAGFQVSGVIFPAPGCWEVTGSVGKASLTFVTLVVEILEPAPSKVIATPQVAASPFSGCSVTIPGKQAPTRLDVSTSWFHDGDLWVVLPPSGTMAFPANYALPNGAFETTWNWWRGSSGQLVVEGERLDAAAPALGVVVPGVYGNAGYQTSELFFPTPGCWRVTGRVGQSTLTFVVQIGAS